MREALPAPLPPETRTVGQLVAESIRFYQAHFWAVLPLGLPLALVEQVTAGQPTAMQAVTLAAASPLMAAAYVFASGIVHDARWSWPAFAAGTLIFVPVPLLMRVFILPAAAWLALFGLAVPAAVVERLRFRHTFARGRQLALADYVHALGGVATLAIVFALTRIMLALLLRGQADVAVRVSIFLADLVLSPILVIGAAILYDDQLSRLDSPNASLHPPVDALDAGRPDAQGEPGPAAGSQP